MNDLLKLLRKLLRIPAADVAQKVAPTGQLLPLEEPPGTALPPESTPPLPLPAAPVPSALPLPAEPAVGERLAAPAVLAEPVIERMVPSAAEIPVPEMPAAVPQVEMEDIGAPVELLPREPRVDVPQPQDERALLMQAGSGEEIVRERLGKPDLDLPPFVIPPELPHVPAVEPRAAEKAERLELQFPRRDERQEQQVEQAGDLAGFDFVARQRLLEYQHEQMLQGYQIMRRQQEMSQILAHDLARLRQQVESTTDAYTSDPSAFQDHG